MFSLDVDTTKNIFAMETRGTGKQEVYYDRFHHLSLKSSLVAMDA